MREPVGIKVPASSERCSAAPQAIRDRLQQGWVSIVDSSAPISPPRRLRAANLSTCPCLAASQDLDGLHAGLAGHPQIEPNVSPQVGQHPRSIALANAAELHSDRHLSLQEAARCCQAGIAGARWACSVAKRFWKLLERCGSGANSVVYRALCTANNLADITAKTQVSG